MCTFAASPFGREGSATSRGRNGLSAGLPAAEYDLMNGSTRFQSTPEIPPSMLMLVPVT
jgi:hypothetical protein